MPGAYKTSVTPKKRFDGPHKALGDCPASPQRTWTYTAALTLLHAKLRAGNSHFLFHGICDVIIKSNFNHVNVSLERNIVRFTFKLYPHLSIQYCALLVLQWSAPSVAVQIATTFAYISRARARSPSPFLLS